MSAGVISERAMRRDYQPLYPNIYVPRGIDFSARERAQAAWLWSKRRGIVAGLSAATMLGAKWIDPSDPAELIHDNRKPPPNLVVRTETGIAERNRRARRYASDQRRPHRIRPRPPPHIFGLRQCSVSTLSPTPPTSSTSMSKSADRGPPRSPWYPETGKRARVDGFRGGVPAGDRRSAGVNRRRPAATQDAIPGIRRVWPVRGALGHGVRRGEGRG